MLGALGVVYGDIGTSPLYTLRECFNPAHGVAPTPENIFGVISLMLWSLILIVAVKYLGLVMRADNKGEGAFSPCCRSPHRRRKRAGGTGPRLSSPRGVWRRFTLRGWHPDSGGDRPGRG